MGVIIVNLKYTFTHERRGPVPSLRGRPAHLNLAREREKLAMLASRLDQGPSKGSLGSGDPAEP